MFRWASVIGCTMIGLMAASIAQARMVNTSDSLVITSPDTLQLKARHHYNAAVLIYQGGRLFVTPVSGSPGDSSGFLWLDSPLIQILDSGKIIADGRGYQGGNPEGGNGLGPGGGYGGLTYAAGGGGGYGGAGGRGGPSNGGGAGGPAYDSSPITSGSGGGAGNQGGGVGGRGGGAIMFTVTTCTISGALSALGENADPTQIEGGGGGAGGGIYVGATNLLIHGVLLASGGNGGDGGDNGGGGGGGGRIKIVYVTNLDTTGIRCFVAGGQGGSATIGEPGLPGDTGTVLWNHYGGIEEREIADIPRVRSRVVVLPNPCRGECKFRFSSIPREVPRLPLALKLYDPIGRLVRTLNAGPTTFEILRWDGRDESGNAVPSGIYFFQASAGKEHYRGKFLLVH